MYTDVLFPGMSMQTHILFSYFYNSKRSLKRQRVFMEYIRLFVDHCEKNYYLNCFKIAEKITFKRKIRLQSIIRKYM